MKLTNDSYLILISTENFTERYYQDRNGWLKVSARGRRFRMTAEQVLNHVLPAVAGIKPNVVIKVEHRESLTPGRRIRSGYSLKGSETLRSLPPREGTTSFSVNFCY